MGDDERLMFGEIEEIEDIVDKRFRLFKNFDVLEDPPSDHHFMFKKPKTLNPTSLESFHQSIEREREILKSSLSNSIYVRTYNSRIDLMRACIIGLEGTPYCYSLFFFDIHFPVNYPMKHPEIFYQGNNGFDLNPNLHKDGRVSFNFFSNIGRMEQPSEEYSNILQVLVSIQRLVLNSNPYIHLKGRKEVFKLSCEAMIYTLSLRAPHNFEDFMEGHFRKRSHSILLVYKKEILGSDQNKAAKGLFFRLVLAFEAIGAYCKHHYNPEELEQFMKENGCQRDYKHKSSITRFYDLCRYYSVT